jgi:lipopolysaccharide biosynthesis protein
MPKKKIIVVTGMHRSGTSAFAKSLVAAGFYPGNDLLPANAHNPQGFFEDAAVIKINDSVLASWNLTWWDSVFDPGLRPRPNNTKLIADAKKILHSFLSTSPKVVLKDPRFCITAPFWLPIFKEMDCSFHCIVIHRHPLNIAASLQKRDGISEVQGLQLCLNYWMSAMTHMQDYVADIVGFEAFSQHPLKTVKNALLRIGEDPEQLEPAKIETVIDASLIHHKTEGVDSASTEVGQDVLQLHDQLVSVRDPRLITDLLKGPIASKWHEVSVHASQMANIAPPDWARNDLPWRFGNQIKTISDEHEKAAAELEKQHSEALSELEKQHSEALSEQKLQGEAALQQISVSNELLQAEITALRGSWSWKVTAPLRNWFIKLSWLLTYLFKVGPTKEQPAPSHPGCQNGDEDLEPGRGTSSAPAESYLAVEGEPNFTDKDLVIWCCYCPTGELSQLQIWMLRTYIEAGFSVVAAVNTTPLNFTVPALDNDVIWVVRENTGFDFGAWRDTLTSIGGLGTAATISFTNDSIIPVGARSLGQLRAELCRQPEGVTFLTSNDEQKPHEQSYFFSAIRPVSQSLIDFFISFFQSFDDKDTVIQRLELNFGHALRSEGIQTAVKFESGINTSKNPTVWHWEKLLQKGFPFIKISACEVHSKRPSTMFDFQEHSQNIDHMLTQHLSERIPLGETIGPDTLCLPSAKATKTNTAALTGNKNVQEAVNLAGDFSMPLSLDATHFPGAEEHGRLLEAETAGILHCFYVDEAKVLLQKLREVDLRLGALILVVDTEEKKQALEKIIIQLEVHGDVVLHENQGRNVAPFLTVLKDLHPRFKYLLHLHTKKSPHNSELAEWGRFLTSNLLSSRTAVNNILHLLAEADYGVVYSTHHPEVQGLRSWGLNFELASALLKKCGISLPVPSALEYPTGMMFWARKEVFLPIVEAGITTHDFPEELGQVDGTLAHAIERVVLYLCESAGLNYGSVLSRRNTELTNIKALSPMKISLLLQRLRAPSLRGTFLSQKQAHEVPELINVALTARQSASPNYRLNLLIPTLTPAKVFGGVTTALQVFKELVNNLGDSQNINIRILVTSDAVGKAELDFAAGFFEQVCIKGPIEGDSPVLEITSLKTAFGRAPILDIGDNDLFFATAWWTANLARRIQVFQAETLNARRKFIYLIQDYESGFYEWGEKSALAYSTYLEREQRYIGVVNSEELHEFFEAQFGEGFICLPYRINQNLQPFMTQTDKKRSILVYARPSVQRNLFSSIIVALELLQNSRPDIKKSYSILCVGEAFKKEMLGDLDNAKNLGKLSYADYGKYLSESAIGLSLMLSPHPSYPPLEMAASGCLTVTNNYQSKNMAKRSQNMVIVDDLTAQSICQALEVAIDRYEKRGAGVHHSVSFPKSVWTTDMIGDLAKRWAH